MTTTQAESTTARLQQAARNGLPVMIPGAREAHAGSAVARPGVAADPTTPREPAEVADRGRLEREREGGGAPAERRSGGPQTTLAALWRRLLHPSR